MQNTDEAGDRAFRRVAWVLIIGLIAPVLDSTIVAVALDSLTHDLHVSVAAVQWVSTSYLLALAAVIPVVGWASYRLGEKRLWLLALAIFLLGSLLSAASWGVGSLVAFRAVQGIGAGLMFPLLQSIALRAADGRVTSKRIALISMPIALGPILGPVAGGLVLNWLDWRWLFLVNMPICILALVLAWRRLPLDRPRPSAIGDGGRRFDGVGLTLLVLGILGTVFGLSNAHLVGGVTRWDVVLPAIAGLILIAAFVIRALRSGRTAILDVTLLRSRPLWSSAIALSLSGAVLYGGTFVLPLFLQQARGATPLQAGLLLIPQGVGILLSRSIAARITDRLGARWAAVLGYGVIAAATLPLVFENATSNTAVLVCVLLARGVGLGATMIPIMTVAYRGLEKKDISNASMLTRLSQQLGGSFGTAAFAVLLQRGADGRESGFPVVFLAASGAAVLAAFAACLLPSRPASAQSSPDRAARL